MLMVSETRETDRTNTNAAPRLLYLHCNQLADWTILDTLRRLRKLSRLTLHCNPLSVTVSTERNQPFYFKSLLLRVTGGRSYRPTLIANLPQLRSLDFSLISEEERDATMLGIRAKFVRWPHQSTWWKLSFSRPVLSIKWSKRFINTKTFFQFLPDKITKKFRT